MSAKFEVKKTSNGQFLFNLRAANNEVILTSEQYTEKAKALNGIEAVKVNAAEDARFVRKTSTSQQPYFVLKAANGEVLGTSELYSSTQAMETGISSVKTNAPQATVSDLT